MRFPGVGNSTVVLPCSAVGKAAPVVSRGVLWVEVNRLIVIRDSLVVLAQRSVKYAPRMVRSAVMRVPADRLVSISNLLLACFYRNLVKTVLEGGGHRATS